MNGVRGGAVGWGATKRKVVGSIPDGVIQIFHWTNPSSRTMTLDSTVSNINEYQEYLLGVKAADSLEIWEPQPHGALRACTGIALTFFTLQWIQ
jgi:hypothetical protein